MVWSWLWIFGLVLACAPAIGSARHIRIAVLAESAGDRRTARRETRSGGLQLALGAAVLIVLATLALITGRLSGALPAAAAAIVLTAAGVTGLLCGLAGKPRPSGAVALALYLLGWALLLLALLPGAAA